MVGSSSRVVVERLARNKVLLLSSHRVLSRFVLDLGRVRGVLAWAGSIFHIVLFSAVHRVALRFVLTRRVCAWAWSFKDLGEGRSVARPELPLRVLVLNFALVRVVGVGSRS